MKDLKVTIIETKPCSVTMNIEVPHRDVLTETELVYEQIQKEAKMPGFRPGKAPMEMVKKSFEKTAREKVMENLIQKSVYSAITEKKVDPVDYPRVHDVCFEFEKPLTFKVKVEKHPEFKVKDYKGIKINKEIHVIDDKKVNETIETLRERNAKLAESGSEVVGANHFVSVDYSAFVDGVEAEELKAKNQMLDMSSAQMIAGFKEGLMGAKKGEEKDIKVIFPKEAPDKKLAGKEVVFKAVVTDIKEKQLPALDDEFAKDLGVQNIDELKTKIKESLDVEEKRHLDESIKGQVIDHLVKENSFDVPESFVGEQYKHLVDKTKNYLSYQKIQKEAMDSYIEKGKEKLMKEAERNVRISYIISGIAKEEKIEVTEEDLKKEMEEIKKRNPGKEKTAEQYFEKNKESIESAMKEDKIFKFLLENAKIKEKTV
jgi:trigger factor